MTRPEDTAEPWCRNLLHTFSELTAHLADVERRLGLDAERGAALWDGYLTVCALSQILDDFLHRGFLALTPGLEVAIRHPEKLDRALDVIPAALAARARGTVRHRAVRWIAVAADAAAAWRVRLRAAFRDRALLRTAGALHHVACDLATLGIEARSHAGDAAAARRLLRELQHPLERAPRALARRVLKIPSCFKDFDVHPDDCRRLVERFLASRPEVPSPITVLGIRTSGTYLAPLCAATLRARGHGDVVVASVRPKVPLLRAERRLLACRGRGGTVLVVDDPPVSGATVATVAAMLHALGIPTSHIVPLVLEDRAAARDDASADAGSIVLRKPDWRIRRVTGGESLGGITAVLARDGRLRAGPLPPPPSERERSRRTYHGRRSRCHDKLRLVADTRRGNAPAFVVKGIGIGWFGDHARETATVLGGFVPEAATGTEGRTEGLLVTRWVDGPTLVDRPEAYGEPLVRGVARYVAARLQRLPIHSGVDGDLDDRETGWHVLARAFARSFSFLAPLAYTHVRARLGAHDTTAPRAVIDGKMGPGEWILSAERTEPFKVDFEEHDFDHLDVGVLDPVFDLAGFAIENRLEPELERTLVAEYVGRTGDHGAPVRMPRYKLMAGLLKRAEIGLVLGAGGSVSRGFDGGSDPAALAIERAEVERQLSATANAFLAAAFDPERPHPPARGLFALDVDGVLEDNTLGFSATTPAGATAIHALKHHGFAPVLASGRSLGEIATRARIFRLPAAVAEYGAVVWLASERAPLCLLSPEEEDQLATLRDRLARTPGAVVDPAYTHSIRVFRCDGGVRRAFARDELEEILRASRLGALRIVAGEDQLDVVGGGCDKAHAVRAVRERLGLGALHAVGDTVEDLSMLRAADRAYAPANVRAGLRAALGTRLSVARHRRGRGLLDAVRAAAHADAARCRACLPPPARDVDPGLLWALGLRDRSFAARTITVARHASLRPFMASV